MTYVSWKATLLQKAKLSFGVRRAISLASAEVDALRAQVADLQQERDRLLTLVENMVSRAAPEPELSSRSGEADRVAVAEQRAAEAERLLAVELKALRNDMMVLQVRGAARRQARAGFLARLLGR